MRLLDMLGAIVQKKTENHSNMPMVRRSDAPLGLHQGSAIEIPDIDIALAQADGSIIVPPQGMRSVIAVGTYSLFGLRLFNCYLDDGRSFVRLVTDAGGRVTEAKLWCNRDEILPQSVEDWEFWLGSYQKDAAGNFLRDWTGSAIRKDWGLIGWPQFQVDGPPAIVYNRAWSPGAEGIEPVRFTEEVLDLQGNTIVVRHEAMEYARRLTDAADAVTESLLATMVQDQTGGSVNLFIGIPLDHQNLSILRS